MSKLAGKTKGIVSLLLTALMVCALAVPGVAAADGPSNDPIGVPGIAAADSGASETRFVGRLELRSLTKGLSAGEMEAIRAEVMAKATAKGLLNDAEGRVVFESAPEFKDQRTVVVAYGFVVGSDGVPSEYVGEVNINGNGYVLTIPQRAQEWYEKELRRSSGGPEVRNTTTTASAFWDEVGRILRQVESPP